MDGKDFTIAVWIKPIPQRKYRFVYRKGSLYFCLNHKDNRWIFRLKDTTKIKALSIAHPIENKWYFVVQRVIQNKEHKVWLFNKRALIKTAEEKNITKTIGSVGGNFQLSRKGWFRKDNAYFKGKIDEVRIFNRALADNEIMGLYKSFNTAVD